jgi:hypothetical protein
VRLSRGNHTAWPVQPRQGGCLCDPVTHATPCMRSGCDQNAALAAEANSAPWVQQHSTAPNFVRACTWPPFTSYLLLQVPAGAAGVCQIVTGAGARACGAAYTTQKRTG